MQTRMRTSSSLIAVVQISVCISALISPVASAQCPTCSGDMDGDANRAGSDIQLFVTCVLAGSIPTGNCTCSDMNASGTIDGVDDVSLFVAELLNPSAACPQLLSLNLASGLVVVPQHTVGMSVSLSAPAPPGGVTILFVSNDPAIATISPSVFVTEGFTTAANNPRLSGITLGETEIVAMAAGYAPVSRTVTVAPDSLNFYPSNFNVKAGSTNSITVSVAVPAPQGGVPVNLAMLHPQIATVPLTTTILQGQTSRTVTVSGVAQGTTILTATAPGLGVATANVIVGLSPVLAPASTIVGRHLQDDAAGSLGAPAPSGGLTVTLTSGDPAKLLLATSPTGTGSASITRTVNTGNSSIPTYYLFALADTGIVEVVATAPGYASGSGSITLRPSGFHLTYNGSLDTTTLSANTIIPVQAVWLDPVTLAVPLCPGCTRQPLHGGMSPVTVDLASSNSAVGSFGPDPTIGPNVIGWNVAFNPASVGSTTLSIVSAPPGFHTPSDYQEVQANVVLPAINIDDYVIGRNLQTTGGGIIGPPAAVGNVTVTFTSSDPTKLLLATTSTAVGTASITRTVSSGGTGIPNYYLQALTDTGTAQLTASAPGWATGTSTVSFRPSGIAWNLSGISTTTMSSNTSVSLNPRYLDPETLQVANCFSCVQQMRAGYGPVTVNVTSSNPAVGTLVTSPLVLNPGQGSVTTQFDPVSVGTTLLSVEPPAGFAMPTNFQQITATVTQPDLYIFDLTVGRNLQVTHSVGMLGVTPPSPVTVTVTSSNGGVVAISTDPNAAGGASVSFPNVASSPSPPFYVQGMSVGTATMVAQAPGFNDRTATITVLPSGFRWGFSGLTTTAGANNTNLPLYTAYLNNGSLIAGSCGSCTAQSIRGGIGPVTVNLNTSNPLVGVLTTNPLVFNVGQSSLVTQFDPLTAGTANITIETPEGFHTPANYQQINANVNP